MPLSLITNNQVPAPVSIGHQAAPRHKADGKKSGIRRAESRHQQTNRKARDHGTEVVGKDSGTNEQSGFNQKPQNWKEKMMPPAFLHQPHRRPKACLPENMHDRVGIAEKLMFLFQGVLLGHTTRMDISSIHFHDTQILRVIEDCDSDTLTMEVEYPVNWELNVFEKRLLVFENVYGYQTFDGPFQGCPTILDASIIGTDGRWSRLSLETNAGRRELSCTAVRLMECDRVVYPAK